ncbi:hypothetical protein [Actinomadura sp. WMMA1423]|uniref:hypothetical protein n=1 Tax=Actinomadura sp. WMMA1423 TaxID=2591108 RepID=UPI001146EE6D|nr:hypothetical protein [Actinomadura sp. WMMA1423]
MTGDASGRDGERRAVYYRRRRLAPQTGPVPEPEVSPSDRLLDSILAGEVDAVWAIDKETGEPRAFPASPPGERDQERE